jgi:hypothetical protein
VQVRAGAEDVREALCRRDQVLEVVEQEQQAPVRDVLGETVLGPQRLGSGLEHELRIAKGCEWNPEDTVGVIIGGFRSGLQGEPRLAGAAGSGQREQADILAGQQLPHLSEFAFAAEKRCCRNRQVRLVERL